MEFTSFAYASSTPNARSKTPRGHQRQLLLYEQNNLTQADLQADCRHVMRKCCRDKAVTDSLGLVQVDNLILRDPPMQRSPLFAGLNLTPLLQPQPQTQPCPGAWCSRAPEALGSSGNPQPPRSQQPALPQLAAAAAQQREAGTHAESGSSAAAGGSGGGSSAGVLQEVRGILVRDAAYLRQAFSDRSMQQDVAGMLRQEHLPQPPCQT